MERRKKLSNKIPIQLYNCLSYKAEDAGYRPVIENGMLKYQPKVVTLHSYGYNFIANSLSRRYTNIPKYKLKGWERKRKMSMYLKRVIMRTLTDEMEFV